MHVHRVTGAIMQPSDQRIKEDIVGVNSSSQQLENIKNIKLYNYRLKEDWAQHANRQAEVCIFGLNFA